MKVSLKFAILLTVLTVLDQSPKAMPQEATSSVRESIEWCDIWISHANETNLPRVLIIGDSIARDYYPEVEKHLAGKAYVARLTTSRFVSDPVILQEIALLLDNNKFDIIHFNNGMHGWQHTESEYRFGFAKFLNAIKSRAPGSVLIWATTTSLRDSNVPATADDRQASNERINKRNAIALEFLKPEGIPIDDLNSLMQRHPECHSDNVHFDDKGVALEAAQVASQIERFIK